MCFFIFLMLFILSFSAHAQNASVENLWRVGVTDFRMIETDSIYGYLKTSIPLALLRGIKEIPSHVLSSEEMEGWKRRERDRILFKKGKELSELFKRKDSLLFDDASINTEQLKLEKQIEEKKLEITNIQSDDSSISVPTVLDIDFCEENKTESLRKLTGNSIEGIYSLKEFDQIIYGELVMVDQWIYLYIQMYNYLTKKEDTLYRALVDPESISRILPDIISSLRKQIYGREPPVLLVKGQPADSFYNLNKGPDFLTDSPVSTLDPGTYHLTVHRDGYYPEEHDIVLKDGEKLTVSYSLKKKKTGFMSISTFPDGADVYSGSMWIGKSPVILKDPVLPDYLSLKKEGYNEIHLIMDEHARSRNFRFFLTPDSINRERMVETQRKKFYNSFAFFIISLSVPVISYGFSSDYGYAYNQIPDPYSEEAYRLMTNSTLWYNIYLGGTFISTSLFINMAIDLWNYIKLYN